MKIEEFWNRIFYSMFITLEYISDYETRFIAFIFGPILDFLVPKKYVKHGNSFKESMIIAYKLEGKRHASDMNLRVCSYVWLPLIYCWLYISIVFAVEYILNYYHASILDNELITEALIIIGPITCMTLPVVFITWKNKYRHYWEKFRKEPESKKKYWLKVTALIWLLMITHALLILIF